MFYFNFARTFGAPGVVVKPKINNKQNKSYNNV